MLNAVKGEVVEDALLLGPDPRRGEGLCADGCPDPMLVRGNCPHCGAPLVSNLYYWPGHGYRVRWECWVSMQASSECSYSLDLK